MTETIEVDFCRNRVGIHAESADHPTVYDCDRREIKYCTFQQSNLRLLNGEPMPTCQGCMVRNIVPIREPVGSELAKIIEECGVKEPEVCSCKAWQHQMDVWGLKGCVEHKAEIIGHLNAATKESTWLDWAKIAAKGYTSLDSLLSEAIKRCSNK
jgi:hypothetical protein